MPDKGNAHVRRKRQSPEVAAADTRRLLDDPAFSAGVERVENGLVNALKEIQHDGTPEMDAYERELCRALRMLNAVTRSLSMVVQGQAFRTRDISLLRPTDEG